MLHDLIVYVIETILRLNRELHSDITQSRNAVLEHISISSGNAAYYSDTLDQILHTDTSSCDICGIEPFGISIPACF